MGGVASEIGPDSTEVIIESAIFDPVSIRRTGQRYGLRSEASLRFEKGQALDLARIGADRCARLVLEWAGGTLSAGRVDSAPDEPSDREVAFRPAVSRGCSGWTWPSRVSGPSWTGPGSRPGRRPLPSRSRSPAAATRSCSRPKPGPR